MFGFGKKQLLRKMAGLANVAQMAVYLSQKEINEKTTDSEEALLLSIAVANYLFGKPADQRHIDRLTLETIESTGNQLIKSNTGIRELVVQSLRVSAITTGEGEAGMAILSTYGKEFPQAPDPESYAELVQKSIQGMSPYVQQSLDQMQR